MDDGTIENENQLESIDNSLLEIISVLEEVQEKNKKGVHSLHNKPDVLFYTCQKVGEELGISFQKVESQEIQSTEEVLESICATAQCRIRRMTLSKYWWKDDCGPLIGFRKQEDRVGVFLRRKEQYRFIDTLDNTEITVNEDNFSKFSSSAFRIYKTLPDVPLNLKHLLSFAFQGLKRDFQSSLVFQFFIGLLITLFPIASNLIFENIIPYADTDHLKQIIYLLILSICVTALFGLAQGFNIIRIRFKSNIMLQSALWDRILRLPLSFFRNYTAGDLANRVHSIDAIQQVLTNSMLVAIVGGLFSVISLLLMLYYDFWIASVVLALAFTAVGISLLFNYLQLKNQRPLLESQGKLIGIVFQLINGINKLRVANSEKSAFAIWAKVFTNKNKFFMRAQYNIIGFGVFYPLFIIFSTIIFYALVVIRGSQLSFGYFIAFNVAFGQFFAALMNMLSVINSAIMIIPYYERSLPIINTIPEIENLGIDPSPLTGKIQIKNLNFRYNTDSPLVLHNISMEIPKGSLIAWVGPSGSGKSTLFRLLLGFEEAGNEIIFYDGHDITMLNRRALRKQIGVVSQNSMIIPGSIYENITSLNSRLTLQDVERAAEQMCILEEIRAMPMGFYSWISEGGKNISVGQRQRILLARAIVQKPNILLLDEATNALDMATEAKIHQQLSDLKITRIMAAHRLSTTKNADCIYVFENGEIVQQGNLVELLQVPGLFKEMYNKQIY